MSLIRLLPLATLLPLAALLALAPGAAADCERFFQDLAKPCGWEGAGGVSGVQVCNENAVGVQRCVGAGCGVDEGSEFAVECAAGSTFAQPPTSFYVRCPPGGTISPTQPCTTEA